MKNKIYPWLVLAACCGLITITFGLNNVTGLFFVHMAADLNCGIGSVSLFLSLILIMSGITGPIAAKVRKKVNVRTTIIACFIACLACYYGVYKADALWKLYLYAIVIGICGGTYGSTLVVELINNWFAKMSGTALGIALAFSGVSGAVLSPIISAMIVNKGWRLTFLLVFCSILIFFIALALIIIRSKPEELNLSRYGETADSKNANQEKKEVKVNIFCKEFFMICGFVTVGAMVTSMGAHMSGFSNSIGLSSGQAALLVSAVMVGNLLFKVFFGIVADSKGGKITAILTYICSLAALVMFFLLPSRFFILLFFAAYLLGTSYSAGNVITQACCQDIFGSEKASFYYAYMNLSILCLGASSTTIIGYIFDFTGSYKPALVGLGVILTITFLLLMKVYQEHNK